jgi:23S rRNA (guanine745-N1)-methyltransferase
LSIEPVVDLLHCPHCGSRLAMTSDGQGVQCPHRHRFDVSRQGYVNLATRPPPANADTSAMVAARERFLRTGVYDPIAVAACRLADLPPGARMVDAGAGTGRLLRDLVSSTPEARGVALDVSPAAARRAARAHSRIGAVVADVWRALPLRDAMAELVVSNFAPRNPSEFARILAGHGRLLTVSPAASHLIELRRAYALLDLQPDKAHRLTEQLGDHFEPVCADRVQSVGLWSAELITDAIAMGPNAFHRAAARAEPVSGSVTVSVDLRLWRARG